MTTDGENPKRYQSTRLSDIEPDESHGDWGPWRLDKSVYVLFPTTPYRYEVDLEDCTTSAEVLDWIFQIAGKTWADDATIAGLVRALDDILHPQATLCSSGQSRSLTRSDVRALVRRA